MPFGLRLKKTRRYNVSGKNSFVARIQLLDSATLEITLTPESLGQDCLDTIAQKLPLEESIYFGLQYSNKNYKLRWVDLEKPLKKQLDKNALDTTLRLGVMLYTNNVQTLRQEITRYFYYLQLKSDIIEGILPCSVEQAICLAGLAAQAELGNFDPAKHTVEFLQSNYVILPKNMTPDTESLSELLLKVQEEHVAKRGLSQCHSELAYIEEAARLEGYGQESFPAKDEAGNELFISASFTGLTVKHLTRQETVQFEWHEVLSMGHNRRTFGVGTTRSQDMYQFHTEDAETAKYVCRICRLQQQFHKYTVETVKLGSREVLVDGFPDEQLISMVDRGRSLSLEGQHTSGMNGGGRHDGGLSTGLVAHSQESLTHQVLTDGQLPNQHFIISSNGKGNLNASELSLDNQQGYDLGPFTTSQLSLDHAPNDRSYSNGNLVMVDHNGSVYSAHSVNSLNYGMHSQVSPNSSNPSLANNDKRLAKLQSSLPAYRQTPDYDSFLQSRLQQRLLTVSEQSQSSGNVGTQNGYAQVDNVVYQPELRQHNRNHNNQYRQRFRFSYDGVPNNLYMSNNVDYSLESLQHGLLIKTPHGNIVHTISVPELTSQHIQTTEEYITAKLLKNKYKPPPPYPRGSASTPNLARQNINYLVSSSSPDIVSRRLQAIEAAHEVSYHGNGNVNIDTDMSQSLPIEAFQKLRIEPQQDYRPNVGVYSRHVSQGYQPRALTLNLTDKASPADLSMMGVPAGYEDNMPSPPIDQGRLMTSYPEYSVPLVSPPSEFADHSDMDNLSPGSVGSPSRHFHLAPQGMGDIYLSNSQHSLPENSFPYMPSPYSQVNGQPGSPTRVYSMPQLHPEMREVNPGQYAMLHVDHANYVNATQGFQAQHQHPEVETVLTGMSPQHPPSPMVAHSPPQQPHFNQQQANPVQTPSPTQRSPQHEQSTQTPLEPSQVLPQTSPPADSEPVSHSSPNPPSKPTDTPSTTSSTSSHPSPNPSTSTAHDSDIAGRDNLHRPIKKSKTPNLPTSPEPPSGSVLEDLVKDDGYIGPLKLAAMSGLTLLRPREKPDDEQEQSKHPRDARRKILEKQLREGQVFTEYEQIPKKKPDAVFYTAKLPENINKNRFPDVLPYEDCRVELSPSQGYINASPIRVPIAGEMLHYIAAQGPLESTAQDWWQMMWDQGTQVIAMLTKLKEGDKEKCFRYWPDCTSPKKNTSEFGPFRVIGQFSNDSGSYITSGLTLRHIPSGEQRTVWHLQYNDWPNQGCPDDVHGFLSFLEEFQSVCRHASSMNEGEAGRPPMVHCSAGVGRSGVLLLADIMISSLEHNEEINIPKMLGILRQQRMLMVQTVGQYTFVYKALIQFLRNTRLI